VGGLGLRRASCLPRLEALARQKTQNTHEQNQKLQKERLNGKKNKPTTTTTTAMMDNTKRKLTTMMMRSQKLKE
jgi:hypothetical protein